MSKPALVTGERTEDAWLADLAARIWSKPEFSMVPIDIDEVPGRSYAGPPLPEQGHRAVFCGIPSDYGTAFLLHLIEQRVNLVAVVCSARWQRTHPKPDLIARIAGHLGRPVEITADANSEGFVRCLQGYAPDVVIMASFDQILRQAALQVPRQGWLNVHPSLLPKHRGPEPIYWTIANGDREAGITIHQTVPRIDAGPILAQRRIEVGRSDTAGTLAKRLVAEGLGALDETLATLRSGRARPVAAVPEEGSYEPPVQHTELDWDQPYARIDRLVRAGHPDQPPFFGYQGQRRFVEAVRRLRRRRRDEALGVVGTLPPNEMVVAVQDAVLAARWRRIGHTHASRPLARQQFP
jgi:methionyl-tRNA formyltransferase